VIVFISKCPTPTCVRRQNASWRRCWYVRDTCRCLDSHFRMSWHDFYSTLLPARVLMALMCSVTFHQLVKMVKTRVIAVGCFIDLWCAAVRTAKCWVANFLPLSHHWTNSCHIHCLAYSHVTSLQQNSTTADQTISVPFPTDDVFVTQIVQVRHQKFSHLYIWCRFEIDAENRISGKWLNYPSETHSSIGILGQKNMLGTDYSGPPLFFVTAFKSCLVQRSHTEAQWCLHCCKGDECFQGERPFFRVLWLWKP